MDQLHQMLYQCAKTIAKKSILDAFIAARYTAMNGKILLTIWFMVFVEQFIVIWHVNIFPDFMKLKGYYHVHKSQLQTLL